MDSKVVMGGPTAKFNFPLAMSEEAGANGRVTLSRLATAAGVSVPTMRKHLAETFGDRITFTRGRTGGMTLSSRKFLHTSTESREAHEQTVLAQQSAGATTQESDMVLDPIAG